MGADVNTHPHMVAEWAQQNNGSDQFWRQLLIALKRKRKLRGPPRRPLPSQASQNDAELEVLIESRNLDIDLPNSAFGLQNVSFDELEKACDGFRKENLLGKGGFGEVYKGRRNNQDIESKDTPTSRIQQSNSGQWATPRSD